MNKEQFREQLRSKNLVFGFYNGEFVTTDCQHFYQNQKHTRVMKCAYCNDTYRPES
jgi:aspartate carbamoyltransferase regulatory subunit